MYSVKTLWDEEDSTGNSSSKLCYFWFIVSWEKGRNQRQKTEVWLLLQRYAETKLAQNRLLLIESSGLWHLILLFRSGLGTAWSPGVELVPPGPGTNHLWGWGCKEDITHFVYLLVNKALLKLRAPWGRWPCLFYSSCCWAQCLDCGRQSYTYSYQMAE